VEQRIPCPDEMCVGTIGEDGKCRYCGKRYEGELPEVEATAHEAEADAVTPEPGAEPEGEDPDDAARESEADAVTPEPGAEAAGEGPDDEPAEPDEDGYVPFGDDRVPCSDEMCTGTIGEDGKCRYCGKPRS